MSPGVRAVQALDDYELEVDFDNGEVRRFDVKPYLDRGVFVRLRNADAFRDGGAVAGSIEWGNALDLSYDTVYLEGQPIEPMYPGTEPADAADRRPVSRGSARRSAVSQ